MNEYTYLTFKIIFHVNEPWKADLWNDNYQKDFEHVILYLMRKYKNSVKKRAKVIKLP